ncbi:PCI-domain-containing protein [Panus rudis PR-1116 ss-1]|nr:PCI-domain-containing protein [Panus rudis PR-1116 ss-1]
MAMEIDTAEDIAEHVPVKAALPKRPTTLPVDDAHPFDLDAYISAYSGRTVVDRLVYIVSLCPTIAPQAYKLAVEQILQLRDTAVVHALTHAYNRTKKENPDLNLPPPEDIAVVSEDWIKETTKKNALEKNKLEVELKTYTSNMIKESIRMAHRDLGEFYRSIGDYTAALKHYAKSREFCTSNQHVLDTCLSVLELLLEQRNYSHVSTYLFKAEAALEALVSSRSGNNSSAASQQQPPAAVQAAKEKFAAEKEKTQTKLDVATALSQMGQQAYEKAANSFLKAGPIKGLEDWASKIVAPGDIAIYATLCALATFSRAQIQNMLQNNDNFGVYIEQETYVRDLLEAYVGNRFKTVLDILERYSTRHYVDIHLSNHVPALITNIQSRALVLYFQPFQSIRLDRMSAAFGWDIDFMEKQVVNLIQRGEIQGRVDRQNKILQAKTVDQRSQLFARALKSGQEMQATNRKLLLRLKLQQADLVIKAPKSQNSQNFSQPGYAEFYGDPRQL